MLLAAKVFCKPGELILVFELLSSDLKKHMNGLHSKHRGRDFPCKIFGCFYVASEQSNLNKHMDRKHVRTTKTLENGSHGSLRNSTRHRPGRPRSDRVVM